MTSVLTRIQTKIDLLQKWVDFGIPGAPDEQSNKIYYPTSLTQARLWADQELGVEKISDPNSFTTFHPKHGSKVVELQRLIKQLRAIQGRQKSAGKSLTEQLVTLRLDHKLLKDRHQKVVSQLAATHEELEIERSQRLAVERVLAELRRKIRAADRRVGEVSLSVVRPGIDD